MSHRHLIQKIGGCSYPSSLICLDVDSLSATDANYPGRLSEVLAGWTGIGCKGVGGVYGREVVQNGTDADSLWQSLAMRCRRGGIIWVLSENAGRVWSLLGLWERIEDGKCQIVGAEHRSSRDGHCDTMPEMQRVSTDSEGQSDKRAGIPLQLLRSDGKGVLPSLTVQAPRKPGRLQGCCILEDPPIVIDVRISGLPGRLRIVDTANYGLSSSLADSLACDRTSRAFRFVTGMIDTLRAEQLGSLKTTSASQAMSCWKTRHLNRPVLVHDNERATRLEEESYYGGRCEATHIGEIHCRVYHLDVSSMYTSICAGANLPSCLAGFSDSPAGQDIHSLLQTYAVLASVDVDTEEPGYPYRDIRSGITVWPVGRFTTSLCGPELQDAHERGRIKRWHRIAWYERSPFLASFALHMLRLRERYSDNSDLRQWAKTLGVSVVGKLGQRSRYWEEAKTRLFHGPWDSWYQAGENGKAERWRAVAGYTQRERYAGFAYDAVPAAASWVTSLGRMSLLNLIRRAGSNHVQYCDTDSLMVSEPGYDNLSTAGLIGDRVAGQLRLIGVSDSVEIRGIKDYVWGSKHVQAGKPAEALAEGWPTGQVWIRPRLKGACYSHTRPNAVRVSVPFDARAHYRHGVVLPDGSVRPHLLEGDR